MLVCNLFRGVMQVLICWSWRGRVIARRRLLGASPSLTTDCTEGTVCSVPPWEASVAGSAGTATAALATGPTGHLRAMILTVTGPRGFTALCARGIGTGGAEGTSFASFVGLLTLN